MDLLQLQYFQRVAKTQSMQQASKELFVSQPTISQSIKRLEAEIGCPLFVHSAGKKLTLNENGELFLERVESALSILDKGVSELNDRSESKRNRFTVACSIFDYCTQPTIAYIQKHPEIDISIHLDSINTIGNLLMNEEVDFAVMPCPLMDASLHCEALYTDEYYVITGDKHPLYGLEYVTLDQLREQSFICNYSDVDRNFLEMLFGSTDPLAGIMLETNEHELLKYYIQQGLGITFMSSHIFLRRTKSGELRPKNAIRISDYKPTAQTCLITKRNHHLSAAASGFYQYLRDYFKAEEEEVSRIHASGRPE